MNIPGTVFVLTGLGVFSIHLTRQVPFYRAISLLQAALKQQGANWSYWSDIRLRLRFRNDPNTIFSETDTPEIRALKQSVIDRRAAILRSLPLMLYTLVCGFGLTVVAMLIQMSLRSGR